MASGSVEVASGSMEVASGSMEVVAPGSVVVATLAAWFYLSLACPRIHQWAFLPPWEDMEVANLVCLSLAC